MSILKSADIPSTCLSGCRPAPTKPAAKMEPFDAAMFRDILGKLWELSDRAVEPHAKRRVKEFLESSSSDAELYDFCIRFRVEEHCSIDSFVSTLCDVEAFYLRPTEAK